MTHTRRGLRTAFLLGTILACCAAGLGLRVGSSPTPAEPYASGPLEPPKHAAFDPEVNRTSVAYWESQAGRDPEGALAFRELAAAYLARHRESGDIADAVRAEKAARSSLKILSRGNASASARLARSLLAQHRFPEALEAARDAAVRDPRASRLVVDVLIELGDYADAESILTSSPPGADDLSFYAPRARLDLIQGHPDAAIRTLREAARIAERRPDMPAENLAWYDTMIGHALVDAGRLDEADQSCREALRLFPGDFHAMTVLASAAVWRGDWPSALAWSEKAIKICPQNFEAIKIRADAQAATGHGAEAERGYARLRELAHSFPRIYDRHWTLFRAEKGRDLDEALTLARADLALRHDVHAHDTLAWVCFKKGLQTEAESEMREALKHETREATLLYHAGIIARTGGDLARARDCFTQARSLNPLAVPLRWLRWTEARANPG